MADAAAIIDLYKELGFIRTDVLDSNEWVIVEVLPVYARLTSRRRGDMVANLIESRNRDNDHHRKIEAFEPTYTKMGLSPADDPDSLKKAIQEFGLVFVKETASGLGLAPVAILYSQSLKRHFPGVGNSLSEAICFAAAEAYLLMNESSEST